MSNVCVTDHVYHSLMVARAPIRSQAGAKAVRARAEARRRAADHQAAVEKALSTYLRCGGEAARLREDVEWAEAREADALAKLAHLVGRSMAAKMAEVDESKVRSALARRKTPSAPPPPS